MNRVSGDPLTASDIPWAGNALTTDRPSMASWLDTAGLPALGPTSAPEHVEATLIRIRELLPANLDPVSRHTLRLDVRRRLHAQGVPHTAAMIDVALAPPPAEPTESAPRKSQATRLVDLARAAGAELFHTPAGDPYLSAPVAAHCEIYPLASRGSRDWLTRLFYVQTGCAPNAGALADAIATLSGQARFDGGEHEVYVRVAGHNGAIYFDIGAADWNAVEITADGWRVVSHPPVRFRRPRGVLSLPLPERGGSIEELRSFLNVANNDDFALLTLWTLAALRPRGPYPILVFVAEQGAAKTTTTRVLRRLIDPNESDVRRPPRNTEDLMIAATNGYVVAFDNLSRLPDDLSDTLSVLATGGGFAVRQLYTNAEEQIFNATRPIILNGITQVATRGDLLDRAIVITLPPIPEDQRKDEASFWAEYDQARPRLLGALLDAVVTGLRRVGNVRLARKPRMADFAMWGVAAEAACPWPEGTFLAAYAGNRQGAVEATLDGDPLVDVVRGVAPWTGTAAELLQVVTDKTADHIARRKEWFAKPRQVSDALRRLAPGLRRIGLDVTFGRESHTRRRLITIEKGGSASVPSSPSVHAPNSVEFWGTKGTQDADASPDASPDSLNVSGLRTAGDDGDATKPLFSGRAEGEDAALRDAEDGWLDL